MLTDKDLYRIRKWVRKLKKHRRAPKISRNLRLPYPILGSGRNRMVYDLKNGYVLKVALTKKGISDCANEQKLSSQAPREVENYLANVIIGVHGWSS